jgi:Zn-dependent protease with chaperone function
MRNNYGEVKKKGRGMALRGLLRWTVFAAYLSLFFILPFALIWEIPGIWVGGALALFFLWGMYFKGTSRILSRMGADRVSTAELPHVHTLVAEHSRRLGMSAPRLALIDTPALNFAVLGFSRKASYLVITRGALSSLSREELSAAIGRELAYLWYGDIFCDSWLSQFIAAADKVVGPLRPRDPAPPHRSFYTFKLFLRQILVYPLSLFPIFVLRGPREPGELDLKAVKIIRDPKAFAEALRRMESLRDRIPFGIPFSCRHLFLLPPTTKDPLTRVFFGETSLAERINGLEKLTHAATLS